MSSDSHDSPVRVELIDETASAVPELLDIDGPRETPGNRAWVLLGVLTVVVALLWWSARPAPGESAAGIARAPVTTTTTAPTTTTVDESLGPAFDDGLERVEFNGFFEAVFALDDGWIGYGTPSIADGGAQTVTESADGLNWTRVRTNLPHDGRLVSLSKTDDVFIALFDDIDQVLTWWESEDATTWTRIASDRANVRVHSGDASTNAVAYIGQVSDRSVPLPGANDYLRDTLALDIAAPVCDVHRTTNPVNYLFLSCQGELLAEVAFETVVEAGADYCVRTFLTDRQPHEVVVRLDRSGTRQQTDFPVGESIQSVRAIDDGVLITTSWRPISSSLCFLRDSGTELPPRLLHIRPDGSVTEIARENESGLQFRVAPAPNGGTFLQYSAVVQLAERGSVEFEELTGSDDRLDFVYAIPNTAWLVRAPQGLVRGFELRPIDDPTAGWTVFESALTQRFPLIIADDFVIVTEYSEDRQYLVKVPRS